MIVEAAEALAKKYMVGTRKGSDRESWRHPEDVVALVRQALATCPAHYSDEERKRGVAAAWMHDLIEDTELDAEALLAAGFDENTVQMVCELTKFETMTREDYFLHLRYAPPMTRIIKVCDRIANLTEGKGKLSEKWWVRYSREAKEKVLPLAYATPCEAWLLEQLRAAIASGGGEFGS